MDIETIDAGGIKVIAISGSLDTNTSPEAQNHVDQLIEAGIKKLIIDFTHLDYISSSGLRVLLGVAKQLSANEGELRLCGMNDIVSEVFEISGFDSILKIVTSRDEAVTELG